VRLRERLITLSLARQAIVKQSAERGANTVAMGIHRPAVDCNAINERGVLHAKLVREGFRGNVKVVERLYREERLTLRRRNRKKIPKGVLEGAWCPIAANQHVGAWILQWTRLPPLVHVNMHCRALNGRKFRTANLNAPRHCPLLTLPNNGKQKGNMAYLKMARTKGSGHADLKAK